MTRPTWVTASAPAKINLHLGVGPVRQDGYHPLATVYQAIGLVDEVTVRSAPAYEVQVSGDSRLHLDAVPLDAHNIAVRAASLLAERNGIDEAVSLQIHKQIPVAGGMAGGSADAAATLVACDALWGLGASREHLLEVAAELGSDVPFALVGGTAIGSGRGETVVPAMVRGTYWWVAVESPDGLSTPAVYREFDAMHQPGTVLDPEIPEPLMEALRNHDVQKLGLAVHNDLERAAIRLRPELETVLRAGLGASALGGLVSGSGPSCLFLCSGPEHAASVARALTQAGYGPVSTARGPAHGARVERTG